MRLCCRCCGAPVGPGAFCSYCRAPYVEVESAPDFDAGHFRVSIRYGLGVKVWRRLYDGVSLPPMEHQRIDPS